MHCVSRSPASFCETYEPMAFISVGKKKKRNQSRFSRKRSVFAMQPGYLVRCRVRAGAPSWRAVLARPPGVS